MVKEANLKVVAPYLRAKSKGIEDIKIPQFATPEGLYVDKEKQPTESVKVIKVPGVFTSRVMDLEVQPIKRESILQNTLDKSAFSAARNLHL